MSKLQEQVDFIVFQTLFEIRSNFKWTEFKKIKDQNSKFGYLENVGVKKLGQGSSRAAFLLSNRYVLKLALPNQDAFDIGIAQNKVEVELATDPGIKPVIASVYDIAEDYSWIVSEVVRELKGPFEFEKLTGVKFHPMLEILGLVFNDGPKAIEEKINDLKLILSKQKNIVEELKTQLVQGSGRRETHKADLYHEIRELGYIQDKINNFKLVDHPMVQALLELVQNKDVMVADMRKLEHWGKTASGKVVLLDYGYSREVARNHYGVYWI